MENVIHHTLLICRNGVIERDDLRLSNMRIERQDDSATATDDSAEALLDRAFQKLFEEQAGALHETKKSRMRYCAPPTVSATTTRCTPPTCWA